MNAAAKQTNSPDDTRQGHLAEADIRLEVVEAGLSRVVLGLESADTIPSYIKLIQTARLHLRAA